MFTFKVGEIGVLKPYVFIFVETTTRRDGGNMRIGQSRVADRAARTELGEANTKIDQRIFIGAEFYKQNGIINASFYRTVEDAQNELKANPIKNSTI